MAPNRNKDKSIEKEPVPPAALTVRLPPPLRITADRYADATGVSLNGLVCIALADYLASRGHQVKV